MAFCRWNRFALIALALLAAVIGRHSPAAPPGTSPVAGLRHGCLEYRKGAKIATHDGGFCIRQVIHAGFEQTVSLERARILKAGHCGAVDWIAAKPTNIRLLNVGEYHQT